MNTNKYSAEQNNEPIEQKEFSLDMIFKSFLRFWWVCLICAVLFAGVSVYRSYKSYSPRYSSSATFTVQTQTGSSFSAGLTSYSFSYNRSAAKQLSSTFPSIISSHILQDIVCNDMGLPYFPCALSASSVPDTNLFTITAEGSDPDLTYRTLKPVIKNYPVVSEYVLGNTELNILHEPVLPEEPSNHISYKGQVVKKALLGFAVGLLWVVFYAFKRNTLCSRYDVRRKLNQNCLGSLPEVIFKKHKNDIGRSVSITNSHVGSGYTESFRAFRNSLVNKLGDRKIILVTSTAPGEGKTSVSPRLSRRCTAACF